MAAKAPTKKYAPPEFGEYRTDGKRLVRVLKGGPKGMWVEDAETGEWEEMATSELQKNWKVVREAEASQNGD